MKDTAIRELYSGMRGCHENIKLSDNYKKSAIIAATEIDAFLEKLTLEQQELFEKVYETISDSSAIYAEEHFIEGFKFGVLIGMEINE